MISKNSFVAGRVYSVVYSSDVEMVQKRDGKDNPMLGALVTVRRVSTMQAAGDKTWANYKAKHGIVTGTREPWWTATKENTCIVEHNKTGVEYLRGLPRGITKEVYMVNGIVATDTQVETIRAFKKNQSDTPAQFVLLSLAKLENVDSGEGDAE
jgi:hypothetical protein